MSQLRKSSLTPAISLSKRRSRFLLNVVGDQSGSSIPSPTNHEPPEQHAVVDLLHQQPLAADGGQHLSNRARNNCSGGIDGRPMSGTSLRSGPTGTRPPRPSSVGPTATAGPDAPALLRPQIAEQVAGLSSGRRMRSLPSQRPGAWQYGVITMSIPRKLLFQHSASGFTGMSRALRLANRPSHLAATVARWMGKLWAFKSATPATSLNGEFRVFASRLNVRNM